MIIQQILLKKLPFSIPNNIKDNNIIKIIQMSTDIDPTKRASMFDIKKLMDNCNIK